MDSQRLPPPVPNWIIITVVLVLCLIVLPIVYGFVGILSAGCFNLLTDYPRDIQWWQVVIGGGVVLGMVVIQMTDWFKWTKNTMLWSVGTTFIPPIIFMILSAVFSWFDATASLSGLMYLYRYETMYVTVPLAAVFFLSSLSTDTIDRFKQKP